MKAEYTVVGTETYLNAGYRIDTGGTLRVGSDTLGAGTLQFNFDSAATTAAIFGGLVLELVFVRRSRK